MKAKHMKRAAQVLMLIVVAALFVYPFWWMLVNSLNTAAQVFGKPTLLPVAWRFVNYVEIFQVQPFARHLMNSVLVALIGTVGNILVSALSGYGFARIRFPGNNILFILLLTALMMPIEVIIVPLFFQMLQWGFSDSLVPLMLIPIFGAQGAFSAFMFRQFFVTVPLELEEAAKLDGLSTLGTFWHIMLPIAKPVIASGAILAFLAAWNTYLEPLVFTSSIENFTLPLSLNNFNDSYGEPQWNLQMAATTVSVLPIMLVYLFFQEKVTDAMVNSGLK
ncbi:MAG: carbohydrate ABC transporter permease [Clostridia bacterium]|nr:carbohydrate ABC transporter permease [Clostridia bacterium]MBQ4609330.1 carbohydrate ABC transporter permease [Clostridia bacterium]MBQ6858896.1 carbohydrate ABC transporter permease [Clostridia bacterium]MBQ7053332.1 carbohydrate ABC transporter permease [Clostridia bacterium]